MRAGIRAYTACRTLASTDIATANGQRIFAPFYGELDFAFNDRDDDRGAGYMFFQLDIRVKGNFRNLRFFPAKIRLAAYFPGFIGLRSALPSAETEISSYCSAAVFLLK